jgi:hypothetical protein
MNVVSRPFSSPRVSFLMATFTTQSDGFNATQTSAGYSGSADRVNASDRPQTDGGQSSSCDSTIPEGNSPLGSLAPQGEAVQRHCFRLDLMDPVGALLV